MTAQIATLNECLDLITFKIGLYEASLAQGSAADPCSPPRIQASREGARTRLKGTCYRPSWPISSRSDPATRPGSVSSARWWLICSVTGQPSSRALAA